MVKARIVKDNGGHLTVLIVLTFRSIFKVIWRLRSFFKIRTPIFDTGFEKSRKFYVKNDIWIFFLSPRRGQIKNLEDVNSILLALPGNNDVDIISSVSFEVLDYHEFPCLSHLGYLIIVSPLASHIWDVW